MNSENAILLAVDERGVATLQINRAEVHNAFDDRLIERLLQALDAVEDDPQARLLLLSASGKSFSAGADLRWMRRMADYTLEENRADSLQLAELMRRLDSFSKPTIARVQGAAFGGGVGLVACCDIAVASANARFCLSEVRLGLIPAVISPYVITAIGERQARRYFQTAERFDALEAQRIGLLHEVVADETALDKTIGGIIDNLLLGGPQALTAAKSLIFDVDQQPHSAELIAETAERITRIRASDEAKEGVGAFLNKRPATWTEGGR